MAGGEKAPCLEATPPSPLPSLSVFVELLCLTVAELHHSLFLGWWSCCYCHQERRTRRSPTCVKKKAEMLPEDAAAVAVGGRGILAAVLVTGSSPEATGTAAGNAANRLIVVIRIPRRCRLRWQPGCRRTGSETATVLVQPFFLSFKLGSEFTCGVEAVSALERERVEPRFWLSVISG
ncbi:uncharacterized protein DS421_15g511880 [Arachis hypogaea]|nr:uncharacterized protein DS421_15g511880 [Arachis hypogaea]